MHDASVGAVKMHLVAAKTLGLDPADHLRAAGIDPAELADPDARIELRRATTLIQGIAAAAPVRSYGLWLGEHFHPTQLSLVGYLLLNASSLRHAIELFCRYQQVIGGAFVWDLKSSRRGAAWLEMVEMRLAPIAGLAQEWSPAAIVTTLRVLSAEPIVPRRAEFAHAAPPWHEEYHRVFGCPITFEAGRPDPLVDRRRRLEETGAPHEPVSRASLRTTMRTCPRPPARRRPGQPPDVRNVAQGDARYRTTYRSGC